MELEKRFWFLVGNTTSGRIDIVIITPLVAPPLPNKLVTGLFKAFDENQDGHVDFKEVACGVSAACRGPNLERQNISLSSTLASDYLSKIITTGYTPLSSQPPLVKDVLHLVDPAVWTILGLSKVFFIVELWYSPGKKVKTKK